jgi:hypothetical protein
VYVAVAFVSFEGACAAEMGISVQRFRRRRRLWLDLPVDALRCEFV